jgi:hypothetical protein
MEEYDSRNIMSESQPLDEKSRKKLDDILRELNSYWIIEVAKARQRSRDRQIPEGNRNTSYFHVVANQRRRMKRINLLEGHECPVTEQKDMIKVATNYYKDLFKK